LVDRLCLHVTQFAISAVHPTKPGAVFERAAVQVCTNPLQALAPQLVENFSNDANAAVPRKLKRSFNCRHEAGLSGWLVTVYLSFRCSDPLAPTPGRPPKGRRVHRPALPSGQKFVTRHRGDFILMHQGLLLILVVVFVHLICFSRDIQLVFDSAFSVTTCN
jgi:hypothetical protein